MAIDLVAKMVGMKAAKLVGCSAARLVACSVAPKASQMAVRLAALMVERWVDH